MENIKEKFEFEVSSEYEGMRLDKYLNEQIEEATRSYLEKLIDNNFVKINWLFKNGSWGYYWRCKYRILKYFMLKWKERLWRI